MPPSRPPGEKRWSGRKLDFIPLHTNIFSAAVFEDRLFCATSYKGGKVVGPSCALVIDPALGKVEVGFPEVGMSYFVGAMGDIFFVGGQKGLLTWRRGAWYELAEVPGGINAVCPAMGEGCFVGGNRFLGHYDAAAGKLHKYRFEPQMEASLHITSIAGLPGGFVAGMDNKTGDLLPGLLFMEDGTGGDDIPRLRKPSSRAAPAYVQEVMFWRGWLLMVETRRVVCIRSADGRTASFDFGGVAASQNPEEPDEVWIGGAGEGVRVIRLDETADTWAELPARAEQVNRALWRACGDRAPTRLRVSCICFDEDAAFVGTEGQGLFYLERV